MQKQYTQFQLLMHKVRSKPKAVRPLKYDQKKLAKDFIQELKS